MASKLEQLSALGERVRLWYSRTIGVQVAALLSVAGVLLLISLTRLPPRQVEDFRVPSYVAVIVFSALGALAITTVAIALLPIRLWFQRPWVYQWLRGCVEAYRRPAARDAENYAHALEREHAAQAYRRDTDKLYYLVRHQLESLLLTGHNALDAAAYNLPPAKLVAQVSWAFERASRMSQKNGALLSVVSFGDYDQPPKWTEYVAALDRYRRFIPLVRSEWDLISQTYDRLENFADLSLELRELATRIDAWSQLRNEFNWSALEAGWSIYLRYITLNVVASYQDPLYTQAVALLMDWLDQVRGLLLYALGETYHESSRRFAEELSDIYDDAAELLEFLSAWRQVLDASQVVQPHAVDPTITQRVLLDRLQIELEDRWKRAATIGSVLIASLISYYLGSQLDVSVPLAVTSGALAAGALEQLVGEVQRRWSRA